MIDAATSPEALAPAEREHREAATANKLLAVERMKPAWYGTPWNRSNPSNIEPM
jgi:hypothetical protein